MSSRLENLASERHEGALEKLCWADSYERARALLGVCIDRNESEILIDSSRLRRFRRQKGTRA